MRVAIIGCGYLGSTLGRCLLAAGHQVTGTTTSEERAASIRALGIEPAVVNTHDLDSLHQTLIHHDAATLCVAPRRPAPDYRSTYLVSARNLIEAARETTVSHVIYTGSTRVYGQDDGSWVDESSPVLPIDESGRILLETEKALISGACDLQEERHFTVTVLRLGGIYGGQRAGLDYVHAAAGTRRDDGNTYINRIHVDDVVTAMKALLHEPFDGVLNLCDDCPQTKRSFYDAVLSAAGLPGIEWIVPDGERHHGKRVRNARIKETLGITLRHPRRVV